MNTPILIRDHFENAKQYNLPRADLIICDLPYELGEKMYASNPSWDNKGDRTQGESKLAHKAAFNTDKSIPRIHPTQKPVRLLKRLISIFTDPGDVVIDCCAGSGSTLRAAWELERRAYGFEVDRRFFTDAVEQMLAPAFVSQPDCT